MTLRRRVWARWLPHWMLAIVAATPVFGASPAQADETEPTAAAAEAWYPTGLGQAVAPLRPEGTLHVGAVAGQETDRTYLRFDLPSLPADAELVTAALTLPVAADAGTTTPEAAEIHACAVPDGFVDGDDEPPAKVDCTDSPTAAFQVGDVPSFTIEVASLIRDDAIEIALVPGGDGTWHVAFDGRSRNGGTPPTITASYSTPTTDTTTPAAPSGTESVFAVPPTPTMSVPEPTASSGQAAASDGDVPTATAMPALTAASGGRFRYPAIFGLPLALLIAALIAGDGLTRPVRLREDPA